MKQCLTQTYIFHVRDKEIIKWSKLKLIDQVIELGHVTRISRLVRTMHQSNTYRNLEMSQNNLICRYRITGHYKPTDRDATLANQLLSIHDIVICFSIIHKGCRQCLNFVVGRSCIDIDVNNSFTKMHCPETWRICLIVVLALLGSLFDKVFFMIMNGC